MKQLKFLSVAILGVLVVAAVGCAPVQEATDEYYGRQPVRRDVYLVNPVYGNETIVLQRDPYTGRYYEVSTYGSRTSSIYDPYYDSRRYDTRRYSNYPRDSRYQRTPVQQPRQVEQPRKQDSPPISDVKKRILGSRD